TLALLILLTILFGWLETNDQLRSPVQIPAFIASTPAPFNALSPDDVVLHPSPGPAFQRVSMP
ncbi:MAG TPA: hypothetical protein VFX76_17760, partial [Roseiflexaceae bacterium]|nr:hypothetical protein [Roseiflexaceae bacterium]